jgi:hypothetical protein
MFPSSKVRNAVSIVLADYSPLALFASTGIAGLPGFDKAVDWRTTSLKSRR